MTRVLQVTQLDSDAAALAEAAQILLSGGIVAFPTETIYGLGAIAHMPKAVERLRQLKERPAEQPFSYHFAHANEAAEFAASFPPAAVRLSERYWPGPLTLVVSGQASADKDETADAGSSSPETVGLRVPANDIARRLIELVGDPLLVPSANPRGKDPATRAEEVVAYFGDKIDAVVDGGECQIKQASTIVHVREDGYEVLREGIITREMVHQLLEGRHILFVCTGNTCRSPMAAALFRKHLAAKLSAAPEDLAEMGYRISSAGTFAMNGAATSAHAAEVLRELGCEAAPHRTRAVTPELLRDADRVYALGHMHYQTVLQIDPQVRQRLAMFSDNGIADPVGGSLDTYRRCAREIEAQVLRLLEHWE